jgi:hypothetical protein
MIPAAIPVNWMPSAYWRVRGRCVVYFVSGPSHDAVGYDEVRKAQERGKAVSALRAVAESGHREPLKF